MSPRSTISLDIAIFSMSTLTSVILSFIGSHVAIHFRCIAVRLCFRLEFHYKMIAIGPYFQILYLSLFVLLNTVLYTFRCLNPIAISFTWLEIYICWTLHVIQIVVLFLTIFAVEFSLDFWGSLRIGQCWLFVDMDINRLKIHTFHACKVFFTKMSIRSDIKIITLHSQ